MEVNSCPEPSPLRNPRDFQAFFDHLHSPTVLVAATQIVRDQLYDTNRLSPADVFRPFGLCPPREPSTPGGRAASPSAGGPQGSLGEKTPVMVPYQLRCRCIFDPMLQKAARVHTALTQFRTEAQARDSPSFYVRFVDLEELEPRAGFEIDASLSLLITSMHSRLDAVTRKFRECPSAAAHYPLREHVPNLCIFEDTSEAARSKLQFPLREEDISQLSSKSLCVRGTETFRKALLPSYAAAPLGEAYQRTVSGCMPGVSSKGNPRKRRKLMEEPWFPIWFEQFYRSTSFDDNDPLTSPAAILLVASAEEFHRNYDRRAAVRSNCFDVLANSLPNQLKQKKPYGVPAPRAYILIHDVESDQISERQAQEAYSSLCRMYPPSMCHLLTTNRGIGNRDTPAGVMSADAFACVQQFYAAALPFRYLKLHEIAARADEQASKKEGKDTTSVGPRAPTPDQSTRTPSFPVKWTQDLADNFCRGIGWAELRDLHHLIGDITSCCVAQFFSRREKMLSQALQESKKGIRNRLRGFLTFNWNNPTAPPSAAAPSTSGTPGSPRTSYSSPGYPNSSGGTDRVGTEMEEDLNGTGLSGDQLDVQARILGDILMMQGQFAAAREAYRTAAAEAKPAARQTRTHAVTLERQAICLFLSGESPSRRELDSLLDQAHRTIQREQELASPPMSSYALADLLSIASQTVQSLAPHEIDDQTVARALLNALPNLRSINGLTSRAAVRILLTAAYLFCGCATLKSSINVFSFTPIGDTEPLVDAVEMAELNSGIAAGHTDQERPPLAMQSGDAPPAFDAAAADVEGGRFNAVLNTLFFVGDEGEGPSKRDLSSAILSVDEAAKRTMTAFFTWNETDHQSSCATHSQIQNILLVAKRSGVSEDSKLTALIKGLSIITSALTLVTKGIALRSALILERVSFYFEIVGRVTSAAHWIIAMPSDAVRVLPAVRRMSRKAVFFLVLAGHSFNKVGCKTMALRCFSHVLPYYSGIGLSYEAVMSSRAVTPTSTATDQNLQALYRQMVRLSRLKHRSMDPAIDRVCGRWFSILTHLRFTMARQAYAAGLAHDALWHFIALMNLYAVAGYASDGVSRETTHMKELLFVFKSPAVSHGPEKSESVTCAESALPLCLPYLENGALDERRKKGPLSFYGVSVTALVEGDEPPESERAHYADLSNFKPVIVGQYASALSLAARICEGRGMDLGWDERAEVVIRDQISASCLTRWGTPQLQTFETPRFSESPLWPTGDEEGGNYRHIVRCVGVSSATAVEITAVNPLELLNIDCAKMQLCGAFRTEEGEWLWFPSTTSSVCVESFPLDVKLSPKTSTHIRLFARFNHPGTVHFTGVLCMLYSIVPVMIPLTVAGQPKLPKEMGDADLSCHPAAYIPHVHQTGLLSSATMDTLANLETRHLSGLVSALHMSDVEPSMPPPVPAPSRQAMQQLEILPGPMRQRPLQLQDWYSYHPDKRLIIKVSKGHPRISYLLKDWQTVLEANATRTCQLLVQNTGTVSLHYLAASAGHRSLISFKSNPTMMRSSHLMSQTATAAWSRSKQIEAVFREPVAPGKCVVFSMEVSTQGLRCNSADLLVKIVLFASTNKVGSRSGSPQTTPPSSTFDYAEGYTGSAVYTPEMPSSRGLSLEDSVWLVIAKPLRVGLENVRYPREPSRPSSDVDDFGVERNTPTSSSGLSPIRRCDEDLVSPLRDSPQPQDFL